VEKAPAGISNLIQSFKVARVIKEFAMKTSTFNALTSAAVFFALYASAVACDDGDSCSYPSYPSYSTQADDVPDAPAVGSTPVAPVNPLTPTTAAAAKARAASVKALVARAASGKAVAAAALAASKQQARISVVSSTSSSSSNSSNTSSVPTARVRVVPAGSPSSKPATARVAVVSLADQTPPAPIAPPKPVAKPKTVAATTPNGSDDFNKSLDTLNSVKDDTSKISDSIKGLVGDWMAVSRQGDGELSTVELQLDNHGWAKLTIPGADGKPSTTTRKVELKDNQLTLTGNGGDVSLGKLVDFDSRQMVLERETGLVTFVRP
jgi:hypothetical protein